MEKHKCRSCQKSFPSGKALENHMNKSHVMNLPIPAKEEEEEQQSPVSSSSSEMEIDKAKRSFRLVDPESGSVVHFQEEDRESETESSKNPTRRRTKRACCRKPSVDQIDTTNATTVNNDNKKKNNNYYYKQTTTTESWAEPESVSSISDATTDEDVAFCLMLLSRDKWKRKSNYEFEFDDGEAEESEELEEESEEESEDESDHFNYRVNSKGNNGRINNRGKYRCDTCHKVFKSYQALGGHRASHKKEKLHHHRPAQLELQRRPATSAAPPPPHPPSRKTHECPYCSRVFSSGQALGGHKRSHMMAGSARNSSNSSMIDLNLPASASAAEDDVISRIDVSTVSDFRVH